MSLSHYTPECTGFWGVITAGGNVYWFCSRCGASGDNCVATREAAIRENRMGDRLEQLTKEGRNLLEGT